MAERSTRPAPVPAKGRAVVWGNIKVDEGRGETHTYERAVLVTFDTVEEFRQAVDCGLFTAPAFE